MTMPATDNALYGGPGRLVRRRNGTTFTPPDAYVLAEGEMLLAPFMFKDADGGKPEAASIDEAFDALPSEFRSKREYLRSAMAATNAFEVEGAARNAEALSRQAAAIAEGDGPVPYGLDPATVRPAARRVAEHLARVIHEGCLGRLADVA